MNLPPKINKGIDIGGVFTALVVDIVLSIICYTVLAPDILTRIAFVAIGVMNVLFIFRSWAKRQYVAWGIFVIVVFFFDLSFTLEATRTQSEEVVVTQTTDITKDSEIIRLDNAILESKQAKSDLQQQFKEAMKRETMDALKDLIDKEEVKINEYEAERKQRFNLIDSGETTKATISANAIMYSIPNTIKARDFLPLFIWSLIFFGLQLIVASSIDNKKQEVAQVKKRTTKKHAPAKKRAPRPKNLTEPIPDISDAEIRRFVSWSWYRVTQKVDTKVLAESTFFETCRKQGGEFDKKKYDYLIKKCKDKKLIDKNGKVIETEVNKAVEALR